MDNPLWNSLPVKLRYFLKEVIILQENWTPNTGSERLIVVPHRGPAVGGPKGRIVGAAGCVLHVKRGRLKVVESGLWFGAFGED